MKLGAWEIDALIESLSRAIEEKQVESVCGKRLIAKLRVERDTKFPRKGSPKDIFR